MDDAGFLMVAGELASAAALGPPVVIVVFVDRSSALKQRQRQTRNLGVDFGATDHAAVALGFGGHGVDVHDRASLGTVLQTRLAADTFTRVAAQIDRPMTDASEG